MTPLVAIILGIVEGITEFLPISSTGHLILTSQLLQLEQTEFLKSFEIAIQLGAILAVLAVSWRTLVFDRGALLRVIAAFIPTAIIGFLFHDLVKTVLLESTATVLWSLLLGGIALLIFDAFHREERTTIGSIGEMTYPQAVIIGLCQAIALIPGVSRAAATIVSGQLLGIKRRPTVEFSFLLAIPTMAAATGLDVLKSADNFTSADALPLALGFITAFIIAYATVRWFLQYISKHSFSAFGIYRIAVAIVGWVWLFS